MGKATDGTQAARPLTALGDWLRALQAHGEWADARLLAAAQSAGSPLPVVVRELAQLAPSIDAGLRALCERVGAERLASDVTYANAAGRRFTTPLGDILLHLYTHGQYHRGKANAELRAAGAEPVGVDYILLQREQ